MVRTIVAICITVLSTIVLGVPAIILVWFFPNFIFRISKLWARLVIASIVGVKVEVNGLEKLSNNEDYIFLSNHQGALDIPALMCSLPGNNRFVAKKELGKIPIFGWAMVALGHVMIDRSNIRKAKESIDDASNRLKNEKLSIIAFPEGTRTKTGKLLPFKKGMFFLAIKSGTPIVPVSIKGSYEIFSKGTIKSNSGIIKLNIHKPIDSKKYSIENKEELVGKVRSIIEKDL